MPAITDKDIDELYHKFVNFNLTATIAVANLATTIRDATQAVEELGEALQKRKAEIDQLAADDGDE